jgi:PAS domain S-box-containing protein
MLSKKDEPDIVKELKRIERLGILKGQSTNTIEDFDSSENGFDEIPDQTTVFFEDSDESQKLVNDNTCEIIEKNIKETVDRYQFIFNNVNDLIIYLDKHGKIIDVNKRSLDIFGLKPNEMVGKKISEIGLFGEKELSNKLRIFKNLLISKTPELIEIDVKHKSGRTISIEANLNRIKRNGKTEGIIGIIRDVSKRKLIEEQLKESKDRYYDLFENSNDLIQAVKPDGSILYVNHSWKKQLGYKDGDLKKLTIFDIIHPDSKDHCMKIFKKVMSGENFDNIEASFITKEGKKIDVEGSVNCRFENNKPVSTRGIFRNVTYHKQSEKILKQNKDRLEAILNTIQTGVVIIDAKSHKIIDVNPAAVELIGRSKDNIIGKVCHKFICPAEVGKCPITDLGQTIDKSERVLINSKGKKVSILKTVTTLSSNDQDLIIDNFIDISEIKKSEEKINNLIKSSPSGIMTIDVDGKITSWSPKCKDIFGWTEDEAIGKFNPTVPYDMKDIFLKTMKEEKTNLEIKALKKDGTFVVISLSSSPLFDEDGNYTGSLGIISDISKEKKAENALNERMKELTGLYGLDKLIEKDLDLDDLFKNIVEKIIPSSMQFPEKAIALLEYDGKSYYNVNKKMKNHLSAPIKVNKIQRGILIVGYAEDLSFIDSYEHNLIKSYAEKIGKYIEKKIAEEKLKESEEKFKGLVNNAPDPIGIVDLKGNIRDVNKATIRLLGYTEKELLSMNIRQVHSKEGLELGLKFFNYILNNGEARTEFEFLSKKGKLIPVLANASLITKEGEKYIQCIFRDITEEKKAEEELQKSEKRYRILIDSSRDAIMTLAPPTWKFTSGNDSTIKLFKAKNEKEFGSMGPWDVSPEFQPDGTPSSEKAKKMIQKAMEEGSNFFEWTHKRVNGDDFPATVLLNRVEIEEGKPFLQATVRDITDQKKATKEIKSAYKKLEDKVKELERYKKITVDREMRMIELKKQIKELSQKNDDL